MRSGWLAPLGCALLSGLSCLSHPTPAPSGSAKPVGAAGRVPAPGAADRSLPDLGAFDFVSSQRGAALVWASKGSGALELAVFDDSGRQLRSEPLLPAGNAGAADQTAFGEVAATTRGSELAVAWLERSNGATRARGFVRPLNGESAGHVVEIGGVKEPYQRRAATWH